MDTIEMFINHIKNRKNFSKNTVDAYTRDLKDFNYFMQRDLTTVSRLNVKDYLDNLTEKGLSTTTINRRLATLKSFYKFLLIEKLIDTNPADSIESSKPTQKLPKVLSINDFKSILQKADNLRDKIMLELLFASGMRRNELITLKRTQIDLNEGVIHATGKGRKDRLIPLYDSILEKLSNWLSKHDSDWVFPSPKVSGEHLSSRQVNELVQKYSSMAGLEGITPHSFRHSFGTYLYENGADIKAIQEMMGHESIDTTNIYSKTSIKRNKAEYLKYHPLNKD